DTASVAKIIKEEGLKGIGAIASTKAAEIYELEILRKEIQNDLSNMTRYFILNKQRQHHQDDYLNNKASLKFIAKIDTGGLADILAIFKKHKLNLTKIQSMPVSTEPWHYSYFIDVSFDDYHQYCQALLTLEKKVKELKILGEYPQNVPVFN
ncbi:MAG: prephenate dehydratase domain-containing protein, partial [Aureibaculum sp.]